MATRRQKLRDIFRAAAERNETAQDLLDQIEAFTASGKSGVETFINETLAAYNSPDPCEEQASVVSEVRAELEAALAKLDAVS